MPIYFYIFVVSAVVIVLMILSRVLYVTLHDEHFFHRLVSHRARKVDHVLRRKIAEVRKFLRYFNRRTFHLLIHLIIEEVEERFSKAMDFVRRKFPRYYR